MLLLFVIVSHHPVYCIWDIVHNDVKVNLIAFSITLSVEVVLHFYDIRMVKLLHHLQFSVLEPFVLEYLFYSYNFASFLDLGLVNDAKSSVSHYLLGIVGEGLLESPKGLTICFLLAPVCFWADPSSASVCMGVKSF